MANIKQAFEYAAQNPDSEFARNLEQLARSGSLNKEAEKYGIDLSPFKQKETLMDKAQGYAKEAVTNPLETAKGVVKGIPGNAAQLVKAADTALTTGYNAVTGQNVGNQGGTFGGKTMLDYKPVEELTSPSNKAQEVGYVAGGLLPVERAVGGVNLLSKGVSGAAKTGSELASKSVSGVKNAASSIKEIVSPTVTKEEFVRDLITPELNKKASVEAIKTGKVVESGLTGSRDVTQAIPNFANIEKSVNEVPGISPKNTLLQNTNAIHDYIGVVADDLVSQLKAVQTQVGKDRGFFSPNEFKGYMDGVKQTLADNPTLVGDAEKTANKILTKFNSLVKEKGYTPTGLLNARKSLDAWMASQKGAKVFDPNTENAVSIALRAIRQGGNDFLAAKVPDVAVKDLLAKQANLYSAIDQIAPKAAKEGENQFERWIKSNPKISEALKYGATAVIGGGAVGVLSQ